MGNVDQLAKQRARVTVTVPNTSGNYAEDRITFGDSASAGDRGESFQGVSVLIEDTGSDGSHQAPSGVVVELWLGQVPDPTMSAYTATDANYFFAGQVVVPANVVYIPVGVSVSYGMGTWPLAGWPLAQLRVKSGGVGGLCTISATAI